MSKQESNLETIIRYWVYQEEKKLREALGQSVHESFDPHTDMQKKGEMAA